MGRYEDEEDEEEDKEEKDVSAEEKGAEEEQVAEDFSDIFGVPVEAQDGEKPHQWVRVGDEANKVPFAGCMVDRDLVLAAGLEETEEEELAALMVGYEQGPHGDKAAEG
ncbi:hypothetical protein K491DRAFT_693232 [Lophiostoma macrostomum CBS 122681]|uniref:Uncharacterized protein n=1 Tax=Lophiostoma macrostomum CBS 122681 TaxID=1314788 RepID=A0A6A6T5P8_9PLEO|nr:hypothetical protein K491DRAFT_693232 [Lophiostoma macrostomum CBS 122681]